MLWIRSRVGARDLTLIPDKLGSERASCWSPFLAGDSLFGIVVSLGAAGFSTPVDRLSSAGRGLPEGLSPARGGDDDPALSEMGGEFLEDRSWLSPVIK